MPGLRGETLDVDSDGRDRRLVGGTDVVSENFIDDSPFNSETVYVGRGLDGGKGEGEGVGMGNFNKQDRGGSEGGEGKGLGLGGVVDTLAVDRNGWEEGSSSKKRPDAGEKIEGGEKIGGRDFKGGAGPGVLETTEGLKQRLRKQKLRGETKTAKKIGQKKHPHLKSKSKSKPSHKRRNRNPYIISHRRREHFRKKHSASHHQPKRLKSPKNPRKPHHYKSPKPPTFPDLSTPSPSLISYNDPSNTLTTFPPPSSSSYSSSPNIKIQAKRLKEYLTSFTFTIDIQLLTNFSPVLPQPTLTTLKSCNIPLGPAIKRCNEFHK